VRALVTGAAGFAGRHLAQHLRDCGDEVVEVDRAQCEITEAESVRATMEGAAPDAVYHLAAISHVGDSWTAPNQVLRVNAEGTLNVLRAAAALSTTPRVLIVGSAEEYGTVAPADLPLSEDAPLRPTTPYGASKIAASFLGLQAYLGSGLEVIRTRSFSHTGPGQEPRYMAPSLAARIAAAERDGGSEIGVGALDPVRDVSDVRDVVRAYRLLLEHGVPGEVYNVCRGEGVSVREVGEHLITLASRPLRLVVDPALVRPVEVPRLVGDCSKLQAATGWEPQYPLSRTLADLLDDARGQASER
jgi:GDP-4-dehydro-6-deoxy-D-mannose reductase